MPLLPEYQAKDDTAIHVVYLPERQLVPRIRAFIDYFVEVFREPPWQKPGAGDLYIGVINPIARRA